MRALALAMALAMPACTVIGPGAMAGTIALHNGAVDHEEEKWSYTAPVLTALVLGAIVDISLLMFAAKQWSHPMT